MSFYNIMHGFNPSCLYVLPMLDKHPDEYPRFRDCFTRNKDHPEYDGYIHVYTRTGGANRLEWTIENHMFEEMDGYVTSFDDSFDSTFATWVFEVPPQWKDDFNHLMAGNHKAISPALRDQVKNVYPNLAHKVDELFDQQIEMQENKER